MADSAPPPAAAADAATRRDGDRRRRQKPRVSKPRAENGEAAKPADAATATEKPAEEKKEKAPRRVFVPKQKPVKEKENATANAANMEQNAASSVGVGVKVGEAATEPTNGAHPREKKPRSRTRKERKPESVDQSAQSPPLAPPLPPVSPPDALAGDGPTPKANAPFKPNDKPPPPKTKSKSKAASPPPPPPPPTEAPTAEPVDWRTAAWFTGCGGNLVTSYWLLTRCTAQNDTIAPLKEGTARHAVALLGLYDRLKAELSPQDDPEEEDGVAELSSHALVAEAKALLTAEQEEEEGKGSAPRSGVVTQLRVDVLEAGTDVLVNRSHRDELDVLLQWAAFLPSLRHASPPVEGKAEEKEEDEDDEKEEDDEEDQAGGGDPPARGEPRKPRSRSFAGILAFTMAQVAEAIAFQQKHDPARRKPAEGSGHPLPPLVARWTAEVEAIVAREAVDEAEEARRRRVAAQIEGVFRRSKRWRQSQVLLFGSSLSKFGSKTSDLDLCLRADPGEEEEDENEAALVQMSSRELRLRKQRAREALLPLAADARDPAVLRETLDKAEKAVEAVANTVVKKAKKTKKRDAAALAKLVQLRAHWDALIAALEEAIGGAEGRVEEQRSGGAGDDALAALRRHQKERQRDIHAAAALLSRSGCKVSLVVAHARVPVIKFLHAASGMECDLCFDNYLACLNTLLLRTYAEVDGRARALGLAIKHWAKRRGVNEASTGHLSSYSFILLVIYFLQVREKAVLPALQDPSLLEHVGAERVKVNGVDVAYCADAAAARAWRGEPVGDETEVGELLLGFFAFYVEQFDFGSGVVSVRTPSAAPMSKRARWGRHQARAWRLSIEDPFEKNRDLGSVLQSRGQKRILDEMARALALLRSGASFADSVCEAVEVVKPVEEARPPRRKQQPQAKSKQGGGGEGTGDGAPHPNNAPRGKRAERRPRQHGRGGEAPPNETQ